MQGQMATAGVSAWLMLPNTEKQPASADLGSVLPLRSNVTIPATDTKS